MSKARKLSAADHAARKAEEYARVMAEKRGLPPPVSGFCTGTKNASEPPQKQPDTPAAVAAEFQTRPSGKGDDFAVLSKPAVKTKPTRSYKDPFDDIGLCFLCKATSCGGGVSVGEGWKRQPRFFCSTCGPEIVKWHAMRNGKLNEVENEAIIEAGAAMGEYLESIGKTDLATMDELEFKNFCRRFIAAYIKTARETARYNMPD